jgi:hypothetical protein
MSIFLASKHVPPAVHSEVWQARHSAGRVTRKYALLPLLCCQEHPVASRYAFAEKETGLPTLESIFIGAESEGTEKNEGREQRPAILTIECPE